MATETTWIVIADGAKARILANEGPGSGLSQVEERADPEARKPTRELGTDRPGRSFASHDETRHAMAPRADWHTDEKQHFLFGLAARLDEAAQQNHYETLVIVAPPHALGLLRKALAENTLKRVAREVAKDLTNTPLHDLAKALAGVVTL